MPAKGNTAKSNVGKKIAKMFGKDFIGEFDKKLYVWEDDGGLEKVQVAISMTIPKILKGLDTDQIESAVTSAFPEEEKPAPKAEVTKEEQETLEQLMKKLGL